MPFLSIIILALVQGITEFLPVSSSGHLILVHTVLDSDLEPQAWVDSLMLDVAVHVGTLFSVLVYFRKDVAQMFRGVLDMARGNVKSGGARLNIYIIISSLPVIMAGFILHALEPSWMRSIEIVAWMTLIFGVVLWVADSYKPAERSIEDITVRDALLIGLAQVLALVPGTSRSGITMIASRFLGFSRTEAARYSLLLAIVAIAGAGVLSGIDLVRSGNVQLSLAVLFAAVISFFAGLLSITLMMKWLEKATFMPFAIYRIGLGVVLLAAIYGGVV